MKSSILVVLALVLCWKGTALATSYNGYADTGYAQLSKRQCCETAVVGAQEDSARACQRAGGLADYRRNASRGKCKWDRRRDAQGRWIYRCTATSTVLCR